VRSGADGEQDSRRANKEKGPAVAREGHEGVVEHATTEQIAGIAQTEIPIFQLSPK
jgi:hypothetical protein